MSSLITMLLILSSSCPSEWSVEADENMFSIQRSLNHSSTSYTTHTLCCHTPHYYYLFFNFKVPQEVKIPAVRTIIIISSSIIDTRFSVVSVCLSVCLLDDNFQKPWRRKFTLTHAVYLGGIEVKFVYEGSHGVKVKVTGAKRSKTATHAMYNFDWQ